ncbi:Uncharacterized protein TCM_012996 [Theobroma cacao]|uniref:Uncharacterized protein n=1 Tax=Theobroma cacao TaxID=3641 RepID=A0A061G332_THECC|nr:Uncharacterized protein TCM_012996 [Theobroma cacao]
MKNRTGQAKGNLTFCFLAEDSSANKSAGKLLQTSGGGGAGSCSVTFFFQINFLC